MAFWQIMVIVFVSFVLGAIFEWVYTEITSPEVGILDVDDESNPDKITWRISLSQKISPEEITKKDSVRFMVFHNGR